MKEKLKEMVGMNEESPRAAAGKGRDADHVRRDARPTLSLPACNHLLLFSLISSLPRSELRIGEN
jgi:hypothetical protein